MDASRFTKYNFHTLCTICTFSRELRCAFSVKKFARRLRSRLFGGNRRRLVTRGISAGAYANVGFEDAKNSFLEAERIKPRVFKSNMFYVAKVLRCIGSHLCQFFVTLFVVLCSTESKRRCQKVVARCLQGPAVVC